MIYPIYVVTGGHIAWYVFNAVASFCGGGSGFTKDFTIVMSIASVFGFGVALMHFMREHSIEIFFKWFALYFGLTVILCGVKMDVQIIDTTDPTSSYTVDNVPFGVAFPAYLASEIMTGVTEAIEAVFHSPDDLSYSNTGMMYGAKIMKATMSPPALPLVLQNNWNDFVRQCIQPDISLNNKYTQDDINQSPNILDFLAGKNMSPLRGIYIGGAFYTCAQAVPVLKSSLQNNASSAMSQLQRSIAGPLSKTQPGQIGNSIETTYSYYLNDLSMNAADIMIQNQLVQATHQAHFDNNAYFNNPSAQLRDYAAQEGKQSLLLQILTLGEVMGDWLPFIQTIVFLAGVCLFPLVIMFWVDPANGFKNIKEYFSFFFYVCSWSAIFDLVNYISNIALTDWSSRYTAGMTNPGITLSNVNSLQYFDTIMHGIAGFLAVVLAIKGPAGIMRLAGSVQGFAQDIFAFSRSAVAAPAASAAVGNMSIGNMSAFDHNANKTDLNQNFGFGQASKYDPHTGLTDRYWTNNHGQTQFASSDASLFTSTGNFSLAFAKTESSQLGQTATKSEQAALSQMSQASQSLSSNYEQMLTAAHQHSSDTSTQDIFSHDKSGQVSKAFDSTHAMVENYGKEHSWTNQQINEFAKSVSFNAGIKETNSFGGNIPLTKIGASVEGSVGINGDRTATDKEYNQQASDFKNSLSDEQRQQLVTNQQTIDNYRHDVQVAQSRGDHLSSGDQLMANVNNSYAQIQQANAQYEQAQSWQAHASQMKASEESFNQNETSGFERYLASRASSDPAFYDAVGALNSLQRGDSLTPIQQHAFDIAKESFVATRMAEYTASNQAVQSQISKAGQSASDQGLAWRAGVSQQGGNAVSGNWQGNKQGMSRLDVGQGKSIPAAFDEMKQETNTSLVDRASAIEVGGKDVNNSGGVVRESFDKNSDAVKQNVDRGVWSTQFAEDRKVD